ncbi:hypothetical protein EGR_08254 [Echinococcus granulosus]|uniref:Uncharacterized protein n=1 Tax=Echinococcus granulosus TaxID=6210 RepID=W6UFI5_ECHGR|nr:hypothetical protein EGR_08254 [Echinococcus granulosus]EUB56902.1 hypothetical protein EGR_08254 [Echinococcus granulosus]
MAADLARKKRELANKGTLLVSFGLVSASIFDFDIVIPAVAVFVSKCDSAFVSTN